jgi:hypothetical protein
MNECPIFFAALTEQCEHQLVQVSATRLFFSFLSHAGVPVSTGITCQPAELAGLKNNPLWHIRA